MKNRQHKDLIKELKDSDTNWKLYEEVEKLPYRKTILYSTAIELEMANVKKYLQDKPIELVPDEYPYEAAFGEKVELNEVQKERDRRARVFEQVFKSGDDYKREILFAIFQNRGFI